MLRELRGGSGEEFRCSKRRRGVRRLDLEMDLWIDDSQAFNLLRDYLSKYFVGF